jgi:ribosomal protein S18 acetylase RimI-like enzyme
MMESAPVVRSARPEEQADALRLLFRDFPTEERDRRVRSALDLVRSGELDGNGLLVEHSTDALAGVLVCLPVPGASALFWPPRCLVDGQRTGREDRLIAHALHWVRSRGAKLAQSLLTADEVTLASPLERNGFRHVTRLWYLASDLNVPVTALATPSRLEYQAYDPERPAIFHETLVRTYEGTLDCPEINGLRTVEEVIAGHKAQGRFDPSRWRLMLDAGRPAGVLLTTLMPESSDHDVSYLGIVPELRRRGFGREAVLKVLFDAKAAGVGRVTLSVDSRNAPALRLYGGLGFVPYDRREVYLAIWHGGSDSAGIP